MALVGILLAAGRGRRFDPSGARNKLMQPLGGDGGDPAVPAVPIVVASASALLAALPAVLAVLRPGTRPVAQALRALGVRSTVCADADSGMAASLAHAVAQTRDADGWLIALGDMPYVRPETVARLAAALAAGADIAVPVHAGQRGNPVGFRRVHLERLLALEGDRGARVLFNSYPVHEVMVDDSGVLRDIDTRADLSSSP